MTQPADPSSRPAPGVRVERRSVLGGLAALTLLSACARQPRRAQQALATLPSGEDPLAWDEFLAQAPSLAELARGQRPAAQDAYLYSLAARAARVESVPAGKLGAFGGLDPRAFFGVIHRGSPFFVVQWRLEPFAVLPAHVHPGTSVCTLALEGEAEIRHYDVDPAAPSYDSGSTEPFRMRETRRQLLLPGRVSTLSATRDNVHFFRAGAAGATGIDVTTMHGGDGTFSFIRFEPERPVDAAAALYEAVWIGSKLG